MDEFFREITDFNAHWNWISSNGVGLFWLILGAVAVYYCLLVVFSLLVKGAVNARNKSRLVSERHSQRDLKKRQKTILQVVRVVLKVAVTIYIVFTVLDSYFGIDLVPLFASAGILGVALGFGAQNIVKDSLAGLFIIFENQYRVGDFVEIDGVGMDRAKGTVERISIRSTMLRDREGDVHFVPNGQVVQVINRTLGLSKVLFTFKVANNEDIEEVRKIINEVGTAMVATKKWGDKIKEAVQFKELGAFDADGYEISVGGITEPGEQWAVASEYRTRLHAQLEKQNIKIV